MAPDTDLLWLLWLTTKLEQCKPSGWHADCICLIGTADETLMSAWRTSHCHGKNSKHQTTLVGQTCFGLWVVAVVVVVLAPTRMMMVMMMICDRSRRNRIELRLRVCFLLFPKNYITSKVVEQEKDSNLGGEEIGLTRRRRGRFGVLEHGSGGGGGDDDLFRRIEFTRKVGMIQMMRAGEK